MCQQADASEEFENEIEDDEETSLPYPYDDHWLDIGGEG